jgi:hypothetical protein
LISKGKNCRRPCRFAEQRFGFPTLAVNKPDGLSLPRGFFSQSSVPMEGGSADQVVTSRARRSRRYAKGRARRAWPTDRLLEVARIRVPPKVFDRSNSFCENSFGRNCQIESIPFSETRTAAKLGARQSFFWSLE